MEKNLLPIGTVVVLRGTKKHIMIIGYYHTDIHSEVPATHDYSGCLFPEGTFSPLNFLAFNQEDIVEVVYNGLDNYEYKNFIEKLNLEIEIRKNNFSKSSDNDSFAKSDVNVSTTTSSDVDTNN